MAAAYEAAPAFAVTGPAGRRRVGPRCRPRHYTQAPGEGVLEAEPQRATQPPCPVMVPSSVFALHNRY
ncbi:hypothetical protein SSAG_00913 [Streptomyces sp. Mg1]|nr:hypothetical protein SSAG_00913 [Streptomyces sp. Mg1]